MVTCYQSRLYIHWQHNPKRFSCFSWWIKLKSLVIFSFFVFYSQAMGLKTLPFEYSFIQTVVSNYASKTNWCRWCYIISCYRCTYMKYGVRQVQLFLWVCNRISTIWIILVLIYFKTLIFCVQLIFANFASSIKSWNKIHTNIWIYSSTLWLISL